MTNSGIENDKTAQTKHTTNWICILFMKLMLLIMFIPLTNSAYYFMISAGPGLHAILFYFIFFLIIFVFSFSRWTMKFYIAILQLIQQ